MVKCLRVRVLRGTIFADETYSVLRRWVREGVNRRERIERVGVVYESTVVLVQSAIRRKCEKALNGRTNKLEIRPILNICTNRSCDSYTNYDSYEFRACDPCDTTYVKPTYPCMADSCRTSPKIRLSRLPFVQHEINGACFPRSFHTAWFIFSCLSPSILCSMDRRYMFPICDLIRDEIKCTCLSNFNLSGMIHTYRLPTCHLYGINHEDNFIPFDNRGFWKFWNTRSSWGPTVLHGERIVSRLFSEV